MRTTLLAAFAAVLALMMTAFAPSAHAASVWIASASNNQCLANSGGNAVLQACSGSRTSVSFPYNGGTNEFYGTLTIGGQCLDVVNNQVKFAACNGKPSQTWKLAGATTQLNDGAGFCIAGSGSSVSVRPCPANGTWRNASYGLVPALASVPKGTPLKVSPNGKDVLNATTNSVVGPGAGSSLAGIVAAGAGNIVNTNGSNIVAAGAGNIVAGSGAAGIVAAGAGN